MADNLPPSSTNVTESVSINLPKPSGPHRSVMGMFCLFLLAVWQMVTMCADDPLLLTIQTRTSFVYHLSHMTNYRLRKVLYWETVMSWLFQNIQLAQYIHTPQDDIRNTRALLSTIFMLHYPHSHAQHEKHKSGHARR
jgi:hypothetical protein